MSPWSAQHPNTGQNIQFQFFSDRKTTKPTRQTILEKNTLTKRLLGAAHKIYRQSYEKIIFNHFPLHLYCNRVAHNVK